jgi:ABC-2 type transport system permease protein
VVARRFWPLLAPRFTVNAAAAAIGYLLGTLAAWLETDLLIGAPPAGAMLGGMLCGAAYLAYAVAVTALAATIVRSTLGTRESRTWSPSGWAPGSAAR